MAYNITNSDLNLINSTVSSYPSTIYELDIYLFVLIIIWSSIGFSFNVLCIRRYYTRPSLRSHFTYIFHFILIYCLIASLFINPSLLIGYYGYAFARYRVYCKCYGVIGSSMYVGIAYSLLYAAIERHYLIFRKNGPLTSNRQVLPMSVIFIFALLTSAAFYLIPTCSYTPCVSCIASNFKLTIIWQAYSFFIPLICSVMLTIVLMIRVHLHRRQFRQSRQTQSVVLSKKLTIHLSIYTCWSLVYYCPPGFYNLFVSIDSKRYSSPLMRSISTIIGVLGIQLYPVLTYITFWNYEERRNKRSRVKPMGANMMTIRL